MHPSRGGQAMSTSTQRRSNLDPLYRRSRSAWTCLLITFRKLPLTLSSLALGGGRGASLGCSTLASLPQAIGVLLIRLLLPLAGAQLDKDGPKVDDANRPGWPFQYRQGVLA
jgi:hypothetical protein